MAGTFYTNGLGEGRRNGVETIAYRGGQTYVALLERFRELRKTSTDAEMLLWGLLRARQVAGAKFRRQHQFGRYILDYLQPGEETGS
ncbi:MAG: DUF559 domain-containing protein [SAR202 cluster bacterium]|nr:DUF559 domain-containing protein [SAR202 cluster bacterium]